MPADQPGRRAEAGATARRVLAGSLALGVQLTAAAAQDAESVSAAFSYNSIDLAALSLGPGVEAYAMETLVTVDTATAGPLAGLRGRCLLSGRREAGHAATGTCVLTDAAGDRLVLAIEERSSPGTVTEGRGRWQGGTGRFAGASGDVTYAYLSYALTAPGTHEGTGRVEGTLALAEPPAAAPEPPTLRLVPSEEP